MIVAAFDHADATLMIVAVIGAGATVAIGVLNFFAVLRNRAVAGVAADKAAVAADQMQTGNEKNLGLTVHDMAQTVEVVAAQIHTNTTELLALHHKADRAFEVSRGVSEKLDRHLTEVSPMVDWARDKMREEE